MRISIPKPLYLYSGALTVVGGGYLLKEYITGPVYEFTEKLTNKVVVVTGSNTGIGKEIAHDLAKREAKVVMACRDMEKCEIARRDIVVDSRNKYVYCRKCDLASQESIREFVDQFKKEHNRLDILINNAGVMRCAKDYTKEGIEMQLGVNHMGHFLLTNLLLDVLKNSAPSRIVNVASGVHKSGTIKLKDLNSDKNYDPGKAYAQSKLANIFFTRELANRLKGTGVTANAVHPGLVRTNIARHLSINQYAVGRVLVNLSSWLFSKSPVKGAQSVLFVAIDPSVKDVTGAYFVDREINSISKEAQNDDIAKWLWIVSEKWTKLSHV